jgi:ABC-type branched-subunit amino acid transport system permease subunit
VQIRESIVDTWEPHAYVTLLVLLVLLVIAVPAGLIAALVVRRIKALAFTTFALSLATMVVAIFNHARLTHRVTALTGQEFGRLWGLL